MSCRCLLKRYNFIEIFCRYEGRNCSQEIDECKPNPCMGGATCKDEINDFTCICPPGLAGKTCDINIDDCEVSIYMYIHICMCF